MTDLSAPPSSVPDTAVQPETAATKTDRVATLRIESWPLAGIKPHPRNPRKHPKEGSPAWEVLKRSLDHDYFDPLVVNVRNGMLVSGHLRWKLLTVMGFVRADVSVVDYDDETHYARMIAANQMLGEFEQALLTSLAADLNAAGIDAALAGLTEKQLMAMLEAPIVDNDSEHAEQLVTKAAELQRKWQVQPGEVFQIGPHRLMCGDCRSLDNWTRLLDGRLADMMWTDPPYNVDYEGVQERRNEAKRGKGARPQTPAQGILNDDMSAREYQESLKHWFAAAAANIRPGGAIYVAHADCWRIENEIAAKAAGFRIAQTIVWVKNSFTLGRQDHQWQHEPILYGWKQGEAHRWFGGFRQTTVHDDEPSLKEKSKADLIALVNQLRNDRDTTIVREPRSTGNDVHPTMKPVRLVARQVWNSSLPNETVLELFGGSGTTLAACHHISRKCAATELDPKYCAVILERLTGLGLQVEKIHG